MATGRQPIYVEPLEAPRELSTGIDADAVRDQCSRILVDPIFSHSKRYSGLLQYIVDRTLEGQIDSLKERIIGIEVFGRPLDYHTGTDATVRVAVTEVRKRLNRYYEFPGHSGELRISLPSGTYVAEFTPLEIASSQPLPQQVAATPPARRFSRLLSWPIAIAGFACLALGILGAKSLFFASPIDEFWRPFLSSSTPVLIAISSPAGMPPRLASSNAESNGTVTLGEFITQQSNYPIAEINAANSLNAFFGWHKKPAAVRLAQATTLSDLRATPAIILGRSNVNPWAMRLGAGLRFQFRGDGAAHMTWVEDTRDPGNRQWSVWFDIPYQQITSEYAIISRVRDSTTGQWWIGIAGESVLGTIAGEQMTMDPVSMKELTARLPKGWEQKNLQAVIQFNVVDGSVGASHVIKTYTW